jgi:ATP-binding cassette, subfamily B, bacterial
MKKFPFYKQLDQMDCGPTCLLMIAKHYGRSYTLQTLRKKSAITREGVSLKGISEAAEAIGFRSLGVSVTFEQLRKENPVPCIVHWKKNHFIVVYKIQKGKVYVADPAFGLAKLSEEEFLSGWLSIPDDENKLTKGIALLLETTPDFYKQEGETENFGFTFLLTYLFKYKKLIAQLLLGMLTGTILQLIFPFLTQAIVDVGINQKNLSFIYVIFAAQLMLFFSQSTIEILRSWILLHISSRINISLISDFLLKLMKLPISFFNAKMTGDILQRIGDHHRIESFLTSTSLSTLFSMVNLVVFSAVMVYYNVQIFFVFLLGSAIYAIWVWFFLKKRKELDYKNFALSSGNQNSIIQIISGMQEIKLHNCEKNKRWEWEGIQAKLFHLNIKSLALNQFQGTGASIINELKNMAITFLVAKSVIDGQMTLGMMLSVQYIIGQMNAPISQFISFIQSAQDASISLERLKEIHDRKDEDESDYEKLTVFPVDKSILFKDLYFSYNGNHQDYVLKNINLDIPEGKITAIVGASGSGKTTLLKLLLRLYSPTQGEILLGNTNLNHFDHRMWRDKCGAVMQDSFIFSDTIARNIAIADEQPDRLKLEQAVKTANIHEFIDGLPMGFNTKIGAEGTGLSQGQRQRLLIARAVYKNPEYLFFDEATNALDSNNEKTIMENLDNFFQQRTVVVVAHRLSTVQKADQIVVMEKGEIVEKGTHFELVEKRGSYYKLVKNQLALEKA